MKWRGVLFLRFLLSLVDESEEIRRLADFLFGNILKGYTAFTVTNLSRHGNNDLCLSRVNSSSDMFGLQPRHLF